MPTRSDHGDDDRSRSTIADDRMAREMPGSPTIPGRRRPGPVASIDDEAVRPAPDGGRGRATARLPGSSRTRRCSAGRTPRRPRSDAQPERDARAARVEHARRVARRRRHPRRARRPSAGPAGVRPPSSRCPAALDGIGDAPARKRLGDDRRPRARPRPRSRRRAGHGRRDPPRPGPGRDVHRLRFERTTVEAGVHGRDSWARPSGSRSTIVSVRPAAIAPFANSQRRDELRRAERQREAAADRRCRRATADCSATTRPRRAVTSRRRRARRAGPDRGPGP